MPDAVLRAVTEVAALVWNAGMVPPDDPTVAEAWVQFRKLFSAGDVELLFQRLLSRRRVDFADDRRIVLATEVTHTPDGGRQVLAAGAFAME